MLGISSRRGEEGGVRGSWGRWESMKASKGATPFERGINWRLEKERARGQQVESSWREDETNCL